MVTNFWIFKNFVIIGFFQLWFREFTKKDINTNDQFNAPIKLLAAVLVSSIAYGPFESDITFLCVVS